MLALCSKYSMKFLSVSPPFLFLPALFWTLSLIHSFSYRLIWFIVHYFSWQSHYGPESCPLVLNAPAELCLLLQWGEYCLYFMLLCAHTHTHNHTVYEREKWARVESHNTNERLVTMNTKGRGSLTAEKAIVTPVWFTDSAVKETTGAQNVVCELNGLRVSVIFINHHRIFCETSRDVIMKTLWTVILSKPELLDFKQQVNEETWVEWFKGDCPPPENGHIRIFNRDAANFLANSVWPAIYDFCLFQFYF